MPARDNNNMIVTYYKYLNDAKLCYISTIRDSRFQSDHLLWWYQSSIACVQVYGWQTVLSYIYRNRSHWIFNHRNFNDYYI